jgi:hypothetical protein
MRVLSKVFFWRKQMKWFKHDSDSSNDAKLKKLRLKYGAQGYGIYWYCLELIARNVEKHNLTFELEHDAELIADDFKLSSDLVQHIMTYMVELGLFEESNGMITCLKMASRTDEYTQKLLQSIKKYPDNITTLSSHSLTKSVLIEENRTEEIILDKKEKTIKTEVLEDYFDDFWYKYPKKVGIQAARKAWNKANPDIIKVIDAINWQRETKQWQAEDGKYIPNPATYLNQGRWMDEAPEQVAPF